MNRWVVEYTDEFGEWWMLQTEDAQDDIDRVVGLLERFGPTLGFPYSSSINGSRHAMRELRIQHDGHPYRILYAFDPVRKALLLLGGDKTGDDRWYEKSVPIADRLFDEHLKELEDENHG